MKQTISIILIVTTLSLVATGCIAYNDPIDPIDPEIVYVMQIPEITTGDDPIKQEKRLLGAKITGTAPPNSTATLSVPILNQGRTFEYVQTVTATPDGTFTLIAPYPTENLIAPADGGLLFATALDMYTVTTAIGSYPVSVSEADVLAGNVITVQ